MEIAISTGFFTKWDVYVNSGYKNIGVQKNTTAH